MNKVELQRKSIKQMKRLPKNIAAAIFSAIDKLKSYPNLQGLDIKTLRNHQYGYRMRVSRYRVLFDLEQKTTEEGELYFIILIQEVIKRDEQTY